VRAIRREIPEITVPPSYAIGTWLKTAAPFGVRRSVA